MFYTGGWGIGIQIVHRLVIDYFPTPNTSLLVSTVLPRSYVTDTGMDFEKSWECGKLYRKSHGTQHAFFQIWE